MIRWVVGPKDSEYTVGKFPDIAGPDSMAQPAVVVRETTCKEIELEVGADLPRFGFQKTKQPEISRRLFTETKWTLKDKDGVVRFAGQPVGDTQSAWCVVTERTDPVSKELEYQVNSVSGWVQFSSESFAQKNAPNLEESEQLMKDQQVKVKTEFSAYLKERSRRAEELGIGVGSEEQPKKISFKRTKKNTTEEERDEDDWEGEQEFSDDDEKDIAGLDDEANKGEEQVRGTIEVEDEDVVDKENDIDEEALVRDTFGDEIANIMRIEHQKENIDDEQLDEELKRFATGSPDDEDEDLDEPQPTITKPAPTSSTKRPLSKEPAMLPPKTSKEEQIRARVKGMFWRNEYKLKLKDVLSQFPGLSRTSEEYQFLTKALKDLADVMDNVLHLKQQFRK